MGEAEDSQAEAHDLGGGQEAHRGGAESTVGEGEERSANGARQTRAAMQPPWSHPHFFYPCVTNSPC